ncbi:MAG: CheR family methyltransferase, partial [Cytophagales bacterium]
MMPNVIEEYLRKEIKITDDAHEDKIHLKEIIALIDSTSPLDFSDYKLPTIYRRAFRRAKSLNFPNLKTYLTYLKQTPKELEALSQEFLISVTSFFRDKEAFGFLQANVIPEILKKILPGEDLKVWVAGCASGEEAYSMAIILKEQLVGEYKDVIVKIFATDIDISALAHAGKGIFKKNIEKDVSKERLENYFLSEGENYIIKPEIRKMVIFAQHDITKNPPYSNMRLISCRNMLI